MRASLAAPFESEHPHHPVQDRQQHSTIMPKTPRKPEPRFLTPTRCNDQVVALHRDRVRPARVSSRDVPGYGICHRTYAEAADPTIAPP